AEGADELSRRVEDRDGVHRLAVPFSVLDVDEASRVDGHSVRLSPNDMRRQFPPAVRHFVLKAGNAKDGGLGSRFVLRPENRGTDRGDGGCGGSGLKKRAALYF